MDFEEVDTQKSVIETKIDDWISVNAKLYPLNPRRQFMCNWFTFFNKQPSFDELQEFAQELDTVMQSRNYVFDKILERYPPVYVYVFRKEILPSSQINWTKYV